MLELDRVQTKLLDEIRNVLMEFPFYWDNGELIEGKLVDDLRSYRTELIQALLSNDLIKNTYSLKIEDNTVFKLDEFVSMLRFKQYWGNDYTKYANDIGLTSEGKYINYNEDVVLDYPYKDSILEGGMTKEDVGKKEVFYHNVLAKEEIDTLLSPKVLTNMKKYDGDGEYSVTEFKDTDNLILKGNNLIALELLKERYNSKVKTIYIDPPYFFYAKKAEDTFLYNSNFKQSTWLTFMKNRLEIAKDLLADDGAIFVQVSDDGIAELHILMKEVFGYDNFINKITVRTKSPSGFASVNAGVFETAEYILAFAKNKKSWTYNIQYTASLYDSNYKWIIRNKDDHYSKWKIEDINIIVANNHGFDTVRSARAKLGVEIFNDLVGQYALDNNEKVFRYTAIGNDAGQKVVEGREISRKNRDKIYEVERENQYTVYIYNGQEIAFYSKKVREIDGVLTPSMQLTNIWSDTPYEGIASEGGVTLKGGKKPEKLIKRIIEMSTDEGDIVLDFFQGSGTTSAVSHKLKRRYIGIEQLDYQINDLILPRLLSVINGDNTGISKGMDWQAGGSFVYAELYELNKKHVQDILATESEVELEMLLDKLLETEYLNFKVDFEKLSNKDGLFEDLTLEQKKDILIEILDLNQLYLNYSEIDDKKHGINENVKKFNHSFYQVGVSDDEQA